MNWTNRPPLGYRLLFAAVWLVNGIQLFGYSSTLWRGKPFETLVHIAFTLLWAWLTTLFAMTARA
jgi:hypothetical protein